MNSSETDLLLHLGTRLRILRQSRGLSQESFASKIQLDRTYISGLERGKRNPSYLILRRLAEALEVPIENLFVNKDVDK